ncbi:hypothetical protein BJY01DRAFT_252545 [Aspergillus pseudoustus]|uniref:N-acetyltransferase domain-containing protein n=1 Tax=Aspergillus pseudoustus TaxID=1810923 RepID=A0ABR4J6B3_9EURO
MSNGTALRTERLCISQCMWSNSDHCEFLARLERTLRIPNGRPQKTAIRSPDDANRSLYHDHRSQWGRYGHGTYLIALSDRSCSPEETGQTLIDPRRYQPIGKISLTTWDAPRPVHATELFVSIMPEYQRHGYATEAARALLDSVEKQYGLTEYFAFATLDTPYTDAARGFTHKLGLQERGLMKRYCLDGIVYSTEGMGSDVFLAKSMPLSSDADLMEID